MAEGAKVEEAIQPYVLDLQYTELHTWRLRAGPHMDADEIGHFYHGDRIWAKRNLKNPSWLELIDRHGWVKEYHEGDAVWKISRSEPDGEGPMCQKSDANPTDETSFPKKCFDVSESMASCSRSSSNVAVERQLLRELRQASFTGQGHKLSDEGQKLGDGGNHWFTGKSYRLAEVQSEVASAESKVRLKWADMVDSDSDEIGPVLGVDNLEEKHMKTRIENFRTSESVRNPRRKKRNQELLQRKNRTLPCRYLQEEGACPFGDACWFAHGSTEVPRLGVENNSIEPEEIFKDEIPDAAEKIAPNSRRQLKSKAVLKKNHKIQLCRYLADEGCCPFGEKCWFAHGDADLRAIVAGQNLPGP